MLLRQTLQPLENSIGLGAMRQQWPTPFSAAASETEVDRMQLDTRKHASVKHNFGNAAFPELCLGWKAACVFVGASVNMTPLEKKLDFQMTMSTLLIHL